MNRFEVMWMYLLVFLAALIVDTIPVFALPAWTVLVVLLLTFHLIPGSWSSLASQVPPWAVTSSACTSRKSRRLSSIAAKIRICATWEANSLKRLSAATFTFLYTLTPLSTTALFTAAGIARVNPWHILPPFFCRRLITDGVMVYTSKYAAGNVSGLLHGQLSIKSLLTLIAGPLVICAFLFIDWRCLLQKRKLRVNFKILR
jgi:hypothetical protein